MFMEKITAFENVQSAFILAIALVLVVFMFLRYLRKDAELKSQDQRQKDAVATQISLGRSIAPTPGKTAHESGDY